MRHDEFGRLSKGLIAFKWLDGLVDRERDTQDRLAFRPESVKACRRGHVNDLKTGSLADLTLLFSTCAVRSRCDNDGDRLIYGRGCTGNL